MICTKIPAKILTLCRSFCLTSKSPVGCGHLDVNTIRFNCPEVQTIIGDSFTIKEDFISPLEEDNLVKEVEPVLKRYKYDDTHIDNAIKQYREIEKSKWSVENQLVIDRIRAIVFRPDEKILQPVHILDLSVNGFIKPHLDSVKFCGPSIGGVSLLSDCIMRFTHDQNPSLSMDVWLKRRSLYIMRDESRYLFKHEILSAGDSKFGEITIPRSRRISIICRCFPKSTD